MTAWGGPPLEIPRGLLAVKYALFFILGYVVSGVTAPSLAEVTSDWYTTMWGVGLAAFSAVAFVGSADKRTWIAEAIGCGGIVSLMAVYAVSPIILILEGDQDRLAYSIIAVSFMVLPSARLWQLLRGGANA